MALHSVLPHTATSRDVIVMHEDQRHWDNRNVMHLYRDIYVLCHVLAGAAAKVIEDEGIQLRYTS